MTKKPRSHRHPPASRRPQGLLSPQQPNWFALHPDLSALGIFFVLCGIFFFEVLFAGKTFLSPDAQGPSALTVPLQEELRAAKYMPLWSPHIFCGMPSFGSLLFAPMVYLPAAIFEIVTRVVPMRVIVFHVLHYILAGMGTYLFLRRQGASFGPALLGGMAFMFTPYLITMEVFGHGSQMMTTAYMPFAVWAIDRLFEKRDMLSLGLAGLIIGLQLQRSHVQISYYILMLLGGYWLYSIIIRLPSGRERGKEIFPLTLHFGTALVLAAALAAMLYLPIKEYTPYSIRGAQSVLQQTSGDTGVGFDYATQWSFSPGEMMTFLLPSFYGFGGQTYWGTMPFTDYPNYMGIVVLTLAIVALLWRRPLTGFFGLVALLALLISFGKHFSLLYRLLYNFLPYFNKFRVPVMILVLVQFSLAVMAGLGLEAILEKLRAAKQEHEDRHRAVAKQLFVIAAILVGLALLVSLAHDGVAAVMHDIYPDQYEPQVQVQIDNERFGMLLGDLWMLALVLGGSLVLVALAFRKKVGTTALVGGLFCLALLDLWVVDFKLNKPRSERAREAYLAADETTLFLQADTTNFRIFPIRELFGENRWAAHGMQSIGGYHAAKPRAYQDLLDASRIASDFILKYVRSTTYQGKPAMERVPVEDIPAQARQRDLWLLDLLNVKYVLSLYPLNEPNLVFRAQTRYDYQGQSIPLAIYENSTCMPRPYLVGAFEHIPQPLDALGRLLSGNFNPHLSVIVDAAPDIVPQPDSSASVSLLNYGLHHIDVRTRSSTPQFLVLSDNYYPVGWSAYLDGQPVKTYRANFCFRAVAVPAGAHRVEFRMHSSAFTTGLWTTVAGVVVVAGLIVVGRRREKKIVSPAPLS